MLKRLGGLLASGALAVTGAVVLTAPAEAASTIEICNSDYSRSGIRAYSNTDQFTSVTFYPGVCVFVPFVFGNSLRIDVESPSSSLWTDVNSYKIGEIGVGWGPCHNSENDASNPDNDYFDNGIRYRNYGDAGC